MFATPTLATRFANSTHVLRSQTPLAEEQMRQAAPSIFAAGDRNVGLNRALWVLAEEMRKLKS
jgi:hypothetical protein